MSEYEFSVTRPDTRKYQPEKIRIWHTLRNEKLLFFYLQQKAAIKIWENRIKNYLGIFINKLLKSFP